MGLNSLPTRPHPAGMSLPAPLTAPVFIFEHGPTDVQQAWLAGCSPQEYAAFLLSAHIHLFVEYAVLAGGRVEHRFLPTVHGVPVGALAPHADAAEALQEGLTCQVRAMAELIGSDMTLDVDVLGLRCRTEQVTDLKAHDRAYFGRTLESVNLAPQRAPHAEVRHHRP